MSTYNWNVTNAKSLTAQLTTNKADPCGIVRWPNSWQNWGGLYYATQFIGQAGPQAIAACQYGVTYKVMLTATGLGGTTSKEIDVAVAAPPVTCNLTVSNSGWVSRRTGYPTSLTFTRTGLTLGTFYWSSGRGMFNQPELNGRGFNSSLTLSYIGIPLGVYNITTQFYPSDGRPSISCGGFQIHVQP